MKKSFFYYFSYSFASLTQFVAKSFIGTENFNLF